MVLERSEETETRSSTTKITSSASNRGTNRSTKEAGNTFVACQAISYDIKVHYNSSFQFLDSTRWRYLLPENALGTIPCNTRILRNLDQFCVLHDASYWQSTLVTRPCNAIRDGLIHIRYLLYILHSQICFLVILNLFRNGSMMFNSLEVNWKSCFLFFIFSPIR